MKKKYERSGPDVNIWKRDAENKTTGALSSPSFLKACTKAGIEPTRRQASKFWKKRGKAYAER